MGVTIHYRGTLDDPGRRGDGRRASGAAHSAYPPRCLSLTLTARCTSSEVTRASSDQLFASTRIPDIPALAPKSTGRAGGRPASCGRDGFHLVRVMKVSAIQINKGNRVPSFASRLRPSHCHQLPLDPINISFYPANSLR